ncbi:MAG: transcription-repair coupling factor [Clostridiales bacterium]|nr:transcription-repair coupling factor [Clostridiales bacterium]
MSAYSDVLKLIPEYTKIENLILKNRLPCGVTGLSYIHKAHYIAALVSNAGKKALVLTPDEAQAVRMRQDLETFGLNAYVYPARNYSFSTDVIVSREFEHERLKVLDKMLVKDFDAVVLSAEAALQLTLPPSVLMNNSVSIENGEEYNIDELIDLLIRSGYVRSEQIDGPGQFSSRGGILDFFSPDCKAPCRVEFFGDTVDSLFYFDVETQRRTEFLEKIHIVPANEFILNDSALLHLLNNHISNTKLKGSALKSINEDIEKLSAGIRLGNIDKYMPLFYGERASVFDYSGDSMLFVCESFTFKERAVSCSSLNNETIKSLLISGEIAKGITDFFLEFHDIERIYEVKGALYLDNLPRGSFDTPVKDLVNCTARQLPPWNGSLAELTDDIETVVKRRDSRVAVLAGTVKSSQMLARDLQEEGIPTLWCPRAPAVFPYNRVCIMPGSCSYGIEYPGIRFSLFTYRNRVVSTYNQKKYKASKNAFNSLEDLVKGEYVVHDVHGIGIFDGIITLESMGTTKDYIKIIYEDSDVLYVPVTQLNRVSRYIGGSGDGKSVKLSKIGGKEWAKTKSRVKASVKEIAKDLIALYSKRMQIKGFPFSPDIDMQNDFERRFEFVETDDQLKCADEIKKDMEKPYPMDRLLCGDVGFGKTEVALRAVFKCIADGKQCAILVPTTILALQHYQTITKRFEGFPVEIAMLSRFCKKDEIDKTLLSLKRGSVDVVVGTHRLISKDVEFRDIGLIIIDEEQRFGVAQKERLKTKYPSVDVLTMTATPIPRTLNMAMSGIRDMSVIEESPQDRFPVQTYVIEHDIGILAQAMERELRRGGQCYYLYNNVEDINKKAAEIRNLLPKARIDVGHGKMNEDELSEVWRKLLEGETDILVCTTIIETGIDVPNVNTLVIENAERMGLAQLHQIRGRVGRSSRRASAYLTFKKGKQLSEISEKRLETIREFTEFGSGIQIAMRDLELRGAGNLLGSNQHGQLDSVGYETYMQLLSEAINEEKGVAEPEKEKECKIDLPIDAHIPEKYIKSVQQRIQIYRRIADIKTLEDKNDVLDEIIDRFGDPPESVVGLITVAYLRGIAANKDIYEISAKDDVIIFRVSDMDMGKLHSMAAYFKGRFKVSNGNGKPYIAVKMIKGENKLALIEKVLSF